MDIDEKSVNGVRLDAVDWRLIETIGNGIPINQTPYLDIATSTGINEKDVIHRIGSLRESGIIKRFGIVVRHHELGYLTNAMVVWDIPDDHVDEFAKLLIGSDTVHLCYRRPRKLPVWPYNLFCMIHGKDRESVCREVSRLAHLYPYGTATHEILFSKRRFKQRGMRYTRTNNEKSGKITLVQARG